MTVFLHSNNLENTVVWSTIASQGYVIVTRGQYIADVGSVGAGTANHMHLEVYKKVSGAWTRVDPYGDGTNNVLWQH
jgi:murein DD-endopeptidase MepM/ murein hydrolase activator NlpD